MMYDIKRYSTVLHHVAMKNMNDIEIEQFFKLLTDITNNMKGVLESDPEHMDYNRMAWITMGKKQEWFGVGSEYEEDKYLADIETLAILMVQMMKRKGLNDDEMSEREINRLEPFERFY